MFDPSLRLVGGTQPGSTGIDRKRFNRFDMTKVGITHCYRFPVSIPPADERAVADAPINLRRLGRVRVLEALARSRRLSRADLVEQTGLARASVGSVVFDLIREGLVEETPDEASPAIRTGRPPQLGSLVPTAAYALGVHLGHHHCRA